MRLVGGGAGDAVTVKVAVPRTAWVEEFFAVTVRLCCVATVLGAVYRPLCAMLPVLPLTDQATVAPEGRLRTENCLVPAGATVAVAGLTLVGEGEAVTAKVAVPRTAWVEEFFAVTVRLCCVATVLGAVYRPLCAMLPVLPLTDQATVAPEGRLRTENCLVPAGATVAVAGLTLVGEGEAVTAKVAVPRTAWVEEFLAVTVTVVWEATVPGAVYRPFAAMLPVAELSDHATVVPDGRF